MNIQQVIVMSAGNSKRWTGEKPKQLTEFNGESLLQRTLRLLSKRGIVPVVTVSEKLLPFLPENFPAEIYVPKNNVQEIDRFLSCEEKWKGDTLFLYGDVFYTSLSFRQIFNQFAPPATFYGRMKGNNVKPYGEMFALRANTEDGVFRERLKEIRRREISGVARGLGWDVFRAYSKVNFVEIDPSVEDFDRVEEVEKFKRLYGVH